jgi:hypothetical protein
MNGVRLEYVRFGRRIFTSADGRQQLPRLDAERDAESPQRIELHGPLPTLDQRNGHRMQLRIVRQLFLRHAAPLAPSPQLAAELLDVAIPRHGCKASARAHNLP